MTTPPSDSSNVIELRPRSVDADDAAQVDDEVGTDAVATALVEADVTGIHSMLPLANQLEALLFVSSTPLTVDAMAEATAVDADTVEQQLLDMMGRFSDRTCGIVLERVAGGWAFRASDQVRDVLARLYQPQADTKLSPAALETMAVVAYLQPISRPDVARIRGVSVDAAMSSLLDRGFVEEAGRSDTGAVLFRTTPLFERAFGLAGLGALPELEGFGPGEEDVQRLRQQLEQMASARVE